VDCCNVAALLNVRSVHIGKDGIDTVEQMAKHKRQVTDAAEDAIVLNADDAHCVALINEYDAYKVLAFSLDRNNPVIPALLARGGRALTIDSQGKYIVVCDDHKNEKLVSVKAIPTTLDGKLEFNIANAMAASALALGLGINANAIRRGLAAVESSIKDLPNRFSMLRDLQFQVVMDKAPSPHGLRAIIPSLMNLETKGRRIGVLFVSGDRPDYVYSKMAKVVFDKFDSFICYENESYLRGRKPGQISNLYAQALKLHGVSESRITKVTSIDAAIASLATIVSAGDLVFIQRLPTDQLGRVEEKLRQINDTADLEHERSL
jgi:cyanophycin synthetase